MAYYAKYRGYLYNRGLGQIAVEILKKDYSISGPIYPLTIAANGVSTNIEKADYFEPIRSVSVSIDIINNKTNFYEYDDLFTISDLEFYVRIYGIGTSITFFSGFIPCNVIEQVWLKNGVININATCNLNRLDEYTPTIFTTKGIYSFIEIIENCLSFTHLSLPININCTLQEGTGGGLGFDTIWVDADLFYQNEIEIDDCKTVLEKILKSFDSIIYYYNDEWYIERKKDLGLTTKNYKRWVGSSVVDVPITNTILTMGTELRPCNMSQKIVYTPGLKRIELTLKEKRKSNLFTPYYNNVTFVTPLNLLEFVGPAFGEWESVLGLEYFFVGTETYHGMKKYVVFDDNLLIGGADSTNFIDETSGTVLDTHLRASLTGLYSRFCLQLNTATDTSINISFKFTLPDNFLYNFTYFVSDSKVHPNNHKFYARFFIGNGITHSWLHMNSTTNKYEFRQQNDITKYGGVNDWGIISAEIPFDSFTDKETYSHTFTTSVSLPYDINITSNLYVIGICELGYNNPLYTNFYPARLNKPNYSLRESVFGEIIVTTSEIIEDNVITGDISSSFIDVGKWDIDLYDTVSYGVSNSLFLNLDKIHTVDWTDAYSRSLFSPIHLPLTQHIIEDRFQIYSKVRREITSDIYSETFIKPFTLVNPGFPNPGTVQITAIKTVIGTNTQFLSTFRTMYQNPEEYDIITVDGYGWNAIASIESDTELHVLNDFATYPSAAGLAYTGGKPRLFYIDGYRFNLETSIYESMSLKEHSIGDLLYRTIT
jgi:hypothetical protein